MARRKQEIEPDTRQRILAAAAATFASHGFAGARIDEIADSAGINKAMLYYHVGDKEGLYTAVLIETIERGLSSLRKAVDTAASPSEKLQTILDTLAAFGSSNPVFIPIILREVASGGKTLPDEMLARMGAIFRVVADVLAEGVGQGSFRRTDPLLTHVTLVGSMMFLVATQPVRERLSRATGLKVTQHSPADLARHIGGLFLQGLETTKRPVKRARKSAPRKRTTRSRS
ncbi:MAG: TetR/AcrR family transcriptional regulator [Acidobacteriota bacterium]